MKDHEVEPGSAWQDFVFLLWGTIFFRTIYRGGALIEVGRPSLVADRLSLQGIL